MRLLTGGLQWPVDMAMSKMIKNELWFKLKPANNSTTTTWS